VLVDDEALDLMNIGVWVWSESERKVRPGAMIRIGGFIVSMLRICTGEVACGAPCGRSSGSRIEVEGCRALAAPDAPAGCSTRRNCTNPSDVRPFGDGKAPCRRRSRSTSCRPADRMDRAERFRASGSVTSIVSVLAVLRAPTRPAQSFPRLDVFRDRIRGARQLRRPFSAPRAHGAERLQELGNRAFFLPSVATRKARARARPWRRRWLLRFGSEGLGVWHRFAVLWPECF